MTAAAQETDPNVFKRRLAGHGRQTETGCLTLPFLNQKEVVEADSPIKDMSLQEMERALTRFQRRPPEQIRGQGAPQTARALLEENKQLVLEKQQRKALERKNSREFVEKLLADDRMVNEADKAKEIGRRSAQQGLAQYYKAKIAEKEAEKANAYQTKLESGVTVHFFPFTEGENINMKQQEAKSKMRKEMRGFLEKQRKEHPPRADALLADTDQNYTHMYPEMWQKPPPGVEAISGAGPAVGSGYPGSSGDSAPGAGKASPGRRSRSGPAGEVQADVAPHMARYPRFLSRAREHMSRRIHDAHVRKALEDKVQRTKDELEDLTRRRQTELNQWEEGLMVNDALRYDGARSKAVELKKNAQFLKGQVEEKHQQKERELYNRRAEPAGYWGPEEKSLPGNYIHRQHCNDLIKQMEVNQNRRLDSRSRRLRQEQRLVDNSVAEMTQDRQKDQMKLQQHKEILIATWDSQRKIREVMDRIDAL